MKRRHFIKTISGSAALAFTISGKLTPHEARAVEPSSAYLKVPPFEYEECSLHKLQGVLTSGKESAVSLTRKFMERVQRIDREGPAIRSVIEQNPDALAIARSSDKERKAGKVRGPLHGIPVMVKDNLDTHDRMMTTAGSLALLGSIAPKDSFVVQQLREAGAILLGKTNLSEWANFRGDRSSSGWSGRGGQTRNPYVLDRNPSGSSSGSGAAVSANLCAVAIGTETDGSIISPSTYCGLVGLKPTLGLVSRSGIIPIAHSQDTAGPMGRTVADVAALLEVISGTDPEDPITLTRPSNYSPMFVRALDKGGLKGARIGVARKFFRSEPRSLKLIEEALQLMKGSGAELIDLKEFPGDSPGDAESQVLHYEFKTDLNKYLAKLGPKAPVKTLAEVIAFNERNRDRELVYFGQETLIRAEAKGPLTEKGYLDALQRSKRWAREEGIDKAMNQHQLDAILAPSGGPAHVTDHVHGDRGTGGSSSLAAVAGYPSITVPCGMVEGLPFGISFFGRAWSEATLLRIAFSYEQQSNVRRAPRFITTL